MTDRVWTKDRVTRLTALWLEGGTAEAIARALGDGVTRSAVLGKVRRLGLRRPADDRRRTPSPEARAARAHEAGLIRPPRDRAAAAAPSEQAHVSLAPLATLLSVRRGCCRWPCDDMGPGGLPVCGRTVTRGAYCATHAVLSYQGRRPASLFVLAGLSEV